MYEELGNGWLLLERVLDKGLATNGDRGAVVTFLSNGETAISRPMLMERAVSQYESALRHPARNGGTLPESCANCGALIKDMEEDEVWVDYRLGLLCPEGVPHQPLRVFVDDTDTKGAN